MTSPEQLFAEFLAREPARPFVTYYDEASGERSELSAKSLANWIVKTHHLLGTELGLGAGDGALLALPAHWVSLAPLFAVFTAGLTVVDGAADAAVAFVSPDTVGVAAGVPDVYAIAPASARVGFGDAGAPEGANDYVPAVRPHEDKWPSVQLGAGPSEPAMAGLTRAELVDRARARAAELELSAGCRVLCTRDWSGPADWIDTVFAPLAVGGSLVYVRNCADEEVLQRRVSQERVTHRID